MIETIDPGMSGRCHGCGKIVEADHVSGGRYGHTITGSEHGCGGDEQRCAATCPVPVPLSCGPIFPEVDG